MTRINELIVNGKSTADFPFEVYVTNNAGFNYAKKKNTLTETLYGSGAIKNEVNAYPPIQKPYTIYCPNATLQDMREVTAWVADSGRLIASDESDVFYEILDVEITDAPLHEVRGYEVEVIFTTMPFGYEHNQQKKTFANGDVLDNDTNAPMYPRVEVYGTSGSEESVEIGAQIIKIRELNQKVTIESKPLEQTVLGNNDQELNSVMSGDFFEIEKESSNTITLSSGIDRIEVLERRAWL